MPQITGLNIKHLRMSYTIVLAFSIQKHARDLIDMEHKPPPE